MPRNTKQNEQMRAESRRKILATSSTLFAQKGYFNVRIAEIATQAKMSPGNIYWYFDSKEAILQATLQDFFDAFEAMLIRAASFPGNAREKLFHLIELQIEIMGEYGKHTNIYMSILGHGGPVLMKSLGFDTVALGMRFHQLLSKIFTHAIQEDVIKAQETNTLVVLYFSFFNGLLSTYSPDWQKLVSKEAITHAVFRLLGVQLESAG